MPGFESYSATVIVPIPVADAVILPGVPAPLPPVDATAVAAGLVLVAMLLLVTAAPLWVTKNASEVDVPPPAAGLKTLTSNVPGAASNADGKTADRLDEEI